MKPPRNPTPDLKLTVQKDYHNLKKGLEVEFKSNFVVVVGDNGAGKTSLLSLLKSCWPGHYEGRIRVGYKESIDKHVTVEGLDKYGAKFDYSTALDSVQGKGFADMDHLLKNNGIALMRASSGQAQMSQLGAILDKLMKDDKLSAENPSLLVLDEPEVSMSLSARMTWGLTLAMLAFKYPIKIITASHDESIIKAASSVYDITTGLTSDSGEAYLQGMRDEFTKKYANFLK